MYYCVLSFIGPFAHQHMVALKKYLGVLWMVLAPLIVAVMVWQAVDKIQDATAVARTNAALQWIIILLVFIPICIGLFIFGMYSFKGYYSATNSTAEE